MKLKQIFSRTSLLLLATPFIMTSCDKDDDVVPTPTITETVVASANFSLLKTAVVRAGLADYLNNTANLTVFAPTNDAFLAAGLTEAVINSTSVATLQAILQYHVLTSKIPSGSVPAGPMRK